MVEDLVRFRLVMLKENKVTRRSSLLLLSITAALLLSACSDRQPTTANAAAPAMSTPAPAVRPAAAADFYDASGPIVVENQLDVDAQRDGMVGRILADTGTVVQSGQLLAELDNRQLTADRDAADAKMRAIEADEKHWEEEAKVVQNDLERDEEMFKAQLITQKQVEHSRYKVVSYRFEIDRERQNLRNAQATLRSLELELDKTRILAPFGGVVARRYVRAGQRVTKGDRLFWVTAMSPLNVKFTVPQEFAGSLKRGEEVSVISQASPGQRHPARVTVVSPVVDPSSGAIEVQAQLSESGPDLLPGMTVNIRVKR